MRLWCPDFSMQNSSFQMPDTSTTTPSSVDDIARVFNTALIATSASEGVKLSAELHSLMESPAFRAILGAVRQLSRMENITEREASEQLIRAFRKADKLWSGYVHQEGIDRLKSQLER